MAHETLRFEFVDGTAELVRHGSVRYVELLEDGHTPVGSVPESDGISDPLEAFLSARFGEAVDTTDTAVATALESGTLSPGVVQGVVQSAITEPGPVKDELTATFVRGQAEPGQDSATVGPEQITASGWTLGAGWTGDLATGFTKTAGNTNPLTWAPPFATGTTNYIVELTVDTPSNAFLNYLFSVTIGGSFPMVMYEGEFLTHTYTRGIRSTVSGNLVITPEVEFAGTVRNISVREVGASFAAPQVFKDSTGATALEVRSTDADLNNVFIGKNTGQANVSGKENVVIGQNTMGVSTSGFWNAAVGFEVLKDNVNGTRNAVLGFYALRENITGHRNIAIGPFALTRNTHGKANLAFGADTLWMNTTGDYNIGLGQAALGETVTGDCNVAIGRGTLGHANGMSNHIAIGDYAAWEIASEADGKTLAIGQRALRNATKGGNLAIGDYAGNAVTTGNGHTIVGHEAGKMVTTALNVTYIGRYAGRDLTGEYNTAVGMNSMGGTAAGNAIRNTGVGYGTLTALQTGGNYNTAIGASAGATVTTGQFNILIGYNAQSISPTDSNYLNIGNAIHGYMSGTKRIGLGGVTNPTAALHVRAGAAGVNGAPIKFTTGGALLTTPEPGALEYDGTDLYITTATGVRKKVTAA